METALQGADWPSGTVIDRGEDTEESVEVRAGEDTFDAECVQVGLYSNIGHTAEHHHQMKRILSHPLVVRRRATY